MTGSNYYNNDNRYPGKDPNSSSEDFEKLCNSIEETVTKISKIVGQGISQAGSALGDAINQAAEKSQKAQQTYYRNTDLAKDGNVQGGGGQLAVNRRFRSGVSLSASGAVMAAFGGMGTLSFGMGLVTELLAPALFIDSMGASGIFAATAVVTGVFLGLSVWLLVAGIKRLGLAQRLKSFKRIFGNRDVVSFRELSAQTHLSKDRLLKESRRMLKFGLLPQGHIDDECTCLMNTDEAYSLYRQAQQDYRRKMAQAKKDKAKRLSKDSQEKSALSSDVQAFVNEGSRYLAAIHALDVDIADKAVSEKIVGIENVVGRIIARVKDEPAVLDGLGKLMDYYLPTTVKLLEAYDSLEEEPVQGKNISSSRREIERTLDVLHTAYEKMLDETYQDMSIDVSADITVLHAMLAQEGLTEDPFDTHASKTMGASDEGSAKGQHRHKGTTA